MRPFDALILTTERLLLRPLEPNDARALYEVFADPEVMRYWCTPPWTSVETAETLIAGDSKAMADGEFLRLAMVRRSDAMVIGQVTLYGFQEQCRRAEMGYCQARASWGQGLMREALTALLEYAFSTLDLHRIEADIDPRNVASGRVLERLGFEREGLLRERWIVGDEVSDTAFYGLLRSDWEGRP